MQWLISTIAETAAEAAFAHDLGLEIADFAVSAILETDLTDRIGYYQRLLAKLGRESVLHAAYMELSPAAVDPALLRLTRERYLQACRIAGELGISRIVCHTGYTPLIYYRNWMIERSVLFWREFLPQLPAGVEILLENVLEKDPFLQLEICQGVNHPGLRACLDLGHANTIASEQTLQEWISVLAPWLSHIHLHDNDGSDDLHLDLGRGTIDLTSVLNHLFALCPEVSLTLEVPEPEVSINWLQKHGFF